jgi:hypothetical protein
MKNHLIESSNEELQEQLKSLKIQGPKTQTSWIGMKLIESELKKRGIKYEL